MIQSEVEVLSRAHQMFAGSTWHPTLDAGTAHYRSLLQRAAGLNNGLAHGGYQLAVDRSRQRLASAAGTDAAAAGVLASAHRDRAQARDLTKSVLDEARADGTVIPVTPMAQREAMRRRVARLHAQRAHVSVGPLPGATTLRRTAGVALPNVAPPRSWVGWTAAAVTERPRRNRGARRIVTTGTTICLGRDGARPVRLFWAGSVELRRGGYSPGPHHLSADQRRDPGAPFASPAR